MSELNVKIYKPKPIRLKSILGIFALLIIGIYVLVSGVHANASAISDLQHFKAAKSIIAGGFISFIFGLVFVSNIFGAITERPRLILSDRNITYQKLWGKTVTENWSNISFFEAVNITSKKEASLMRAFVVGPSTGQTTGHSREFALPSAIFTSDGYALLDEINRRRATAVGEQYLPAPRPEESSQKPQRKKLNSYRYWILWFACVSLVLLAFVRPVVAALKLPDHPYQNEIVFMIMIVGALVASFKLKTRK